MEWDPIILTLELAAVTTLVLFILGIPLAYWLSTWQSPFKHALEAVISLPLVLPPTVLGFYLLIAFSPANWLGSWLDQINIHLLFSFEGLVLASVIYSLPFMVQPVLAALSSLPSSLADASYTIGKSKVQTLLYVLLPNIKPALWTAVTLTFAHTVGEFGVVLMIGGNIPGKTRVASIAIYDQVEAMNYGTANQYALILMGVSLAFLLSVYYFRGHQNWLGK